MLRRALTRFATPAGGTCAALVVILVIVAVIGHRRLTEAKRPEARAATMPTRLALAPGEERSYALHLESRAEITGDSGGAVEIDLDGTLEVTTLATEANGATLLVRVREPHLSVKQGGVASDAVGPTMASLDGGLYATIATNGVVRSVHEATLDRLADRLLRHAIASLQTALPTAAQAASWSARESDGTGTYAASYRARGDDDATAISIEKDKDGYAAMRREARGTAAPPTTGTVRGRASTRVDRDDGWTRLVSGEERAAVAIGTLVSSATTRSRLELVGKRTLDAQALATRAQARRGGSSDEAANDDAIRRAHARARLAGKTLAEMREQYNKLGNVDPRTRANRERELFDETVAWIRLHEDDLEEMRATLRGRAPSDPWLANSLGALAYAGCAKCQSAVAAEIMARNGTRDFKDLVPLLAESKVPSMESEAALRKLEGSPDRPTRDSAALALATVAQKTAGVDATRADRIVQGFTERLQHASTDGAKLAALALLGNTGARSLPSELESYLRDPSEDIRAAAVLSLRLCPVEETAPILQRMLGDPSPRVRSAVVEAFAAERPTPFAGTVLAQRLDVEPSPAVRLAVVRLLERYVLSLDVARQAVDRAAENDPDPSVRSAASSIRIMFRSAR